MLSLCTIGSFGVGIAEMGSKQSAFSEFKTHIQEVIPLDRNYLHILVGGAMLAVYVTWKVWRKRQFRGREIVGFVLAVAVVGELFDIWDDIAEKGVPDIPESVKDILLTVCIPALGAIGHQLLGYAIRFRQKSRS